MIFRSVLNKYPSRVYLFLILSTYITIFTSNFAFYCSLIFLCIYYYGNAHTLKTSLEAKSTVMLPIFFYVVKIFEATARNDLLFWDNQYLLQKLRCNIFQEDIFLQLANISYGCRNSLGFGILEDIIKIDIDPWNGSLFIFFIVSILLTIFLFSLDKEHLFIVMIFLVSPAFRFLLLSLNSDIFILIYIVSLFFRKNLNFRIYDYILLSLFIQLKIYALGIIFGYSMYSLISKNFKNFCGSIFFLIANLIITFKYHIGTDIFYSTTSSGVPYVYAPLSSFGLLADILTYRDVQISHLLANFNVIKIFIPALIMSFYLIISRVFQNFYNDIGEIYIKVFILTTPMVFLINIFANHGYKFVFNFVPIFILINYLGKQVQILFISTVIITPIFYFLNFDYCCRTYLASPISTMILLSSRYFFYSINFIFFIFFLLFLSQTGKVVNNKKVKK